MPIDGLPLDASVVRSARAVVAVPYSEMSASQPGIPRRSMRAAPGILRAGSDI